MSSIVSPPNTPAGAPHRDEHPPEPRELGSGGDVLVPHILIQLEDDLERAHRREAAVISVAVHLLAVIFLLLSPKLFPGLRGVVIANPADLMRDKQLTYLDMPPDEQTPPKQVKPDAKLSDKNRIAESKHPQLDQKTIEELRKAGPPKPPGPQAQPSPQAAPPSPQGIQAPQQPTQQAQSLPPQQEPKLPMPQQQPAQGNVPDFRSMMSQN